MIMGGLTVEKDVSGKEIHDYFFLEKRLPRAKAKQRKTDSEGSRWWSNQRKP